MILSYVTGRIASTVERISLSKRIILCRLLPYKNGISQNIGSPKYIHKLASSEQSMRNREIVYRQKDNVDRNYELVYFYPDHRSSSMLVIAIYFLYVTCVASLIIFHFTFKPPKEDHRVSFLTDRRPPLVRNKIDIFVPMIWMMILLFFIQMFFKSTVARMYMNREKSEYLVVYLRDLLKKPNIVIPFNCLTPKFRMAIFAGREVIFNANGHTVVLYEEHFKTIYLAKNILTNCNRSL